MRPRRLGTWPARDIIPKDPKGISASEIFERGNGITNAPFLYCADLRASRRERPILGVPRRRKLPINTRADNASSKWATVLHEVSTIADPATSVPKSSLELVYSGLQRAAGASPSGELFDFVSS
jgi:hypothetical protein